MFITMLKYQLIKVLHTRDILFWSLLFPMILGILFFLSFGSMDTGEDDFTKIPVACVEVEENAALSTVLEQLNASGENQMIQMTKTDDAKAKQLLKDGKVEGIIYIKSDAELVVSKSGISQSILKEILDRYKRTIQMAVQLQMTPDKIAQFTADLQKDYLVEKTTTDTSHDWTLAYFYALIGMACIYGSLWGLNIATGIEGNISAIGARRLTTPTNKLKMLFTDFLAALIVHVAELCIVIAFLVFGLGIDFGNQIGYILMATVMGSIIGITMGLFIGLVVPGSKALKESVTFAVSMLFSFFSGLMVGNMKYLVEKYFPLGNKINPCSLLTDCYYSLSVYSNKTAYWGYMLNMLIIAIVLIFGSYLLVRRRKYASI